MPGTNAGDVRAMGSSWRSHGWLFEKVAVSRWAWHGEMPQNDGINSGIGLCRLIAPWL